MARRSTRRVGEPGDMTVTVDALKETAPGETPVAVTPASVQRPRASEIDVLVERDAGAGALLPTRTYTDVGARVDDAEQLIRRADAVLASRTRCPATRTAASGPAPLRTVASLHNIRACRRTRRCASLHNNRARRRTRRCRRHRGEFGTCCCTRSAAPSRWIHSPRRQTSPGRRRTT